MRRLTVHVWVIRSVLNSEKCFICLSLGSAYVTRCAVSASLVVKCEQIKSTNINLKQQFELSYCGYLDSKWLMQKVK